MGGAGAAGHELVILVGALIGLVLVGRFAWRQFDHSGTPGQRVGAVVALLGLAGVIVIIAAIAINAS
jgi:hypothetical protein